MQSDRERGFVDECRCRFVKPNGLPRYMRGENEGQKGSEGKRKEHGHAEFIWFLFFFFSHSVSFSTI